MKKTIPQSSILNLEDYQLWPAPGHLLSLQGLPLLSKEPFIHPSGRRLRHGFHDTKCSPTREPPLHTAYAAGLSTKLSNIHSRAGNFILSRKNQVLGITRCIHEAAIRRAGFHTLQPVLFESKPKIARDTCSPRPGAEILLQFLGVLWSPNGQVNDKRHDIPHRRAAQFECGSSRRFVTRGS